MDTHNKDPKRTYDMGLNQFSDWTEDEFKSLLTYQPKEDYSVSLLESEDDVKITGAIDWQQNGKVKPVRNQGSCGSCWAFAACANVESIYLIAGRDSGVLSP